MNQESRYAKCPAKEELSHFIRGKCDEHKSRAIAGHVAGCRACMETVDSDDSLIIALLSRSGPDVTSESSNAEQNAIELARQALTQGWEDSTVHSHFMDIPDAIGDYEILDRLGSGGMGTVFKARHRRLKRLVAIKTLKPSLTREPLAVRRFEREMEAIGKLEHPYIVVAHDAGTIEGIHYLAMEFIGGVEAAQLIRKQHSVSMADSCEIIRQAALALSHAHQAGLVHRDVKPSNLMIARSGTVKLLDLGLASLEQVDAESGGLTMANQVMGTIDYMAPEQAEPGVIVDQRTDIYGLGATLFHLLTGRTLFDFAPKLPAWKRIACIAQEMPDRISDVCPELPSGLVNLVDRMLERDPQRRIASASQIAERMEEFCKGADLTSLASSVTKHLDRSGTKQISHDLNDRVPSGSTVLLDTRFRMHRIPRTVLHSGAAVLMMLVAAIVMSSLPSLERSDRLRQADSRTDRMVTAGTAIDQAGERTPVWPARVQRSQLPGHLDAAAAFPGIADWQIAGENNSSTARFSPDGRYLLKTWCNDHRYIVLMDVASDDMLRVHLSKQGPNWYGISSASWAPDSSRYCIIAASSTPSVSIVDVDNSVRPRIFQLPQHLNVQSCAWSPDGRWIAVADGGEGNRQMIQLWTPEGEPGPIVLNERVEERKPTTLAWSPQANELVGCMDDGSAVLIDLKSNGSFQWLGEIREKFHAAAWSPDGQWIALASYESVLCLYSRDGRLRRQVTVSDCVAQDLQWSMDSKFLLAAGRRSYVVPVDGEPIPMQNDYTSGDVVILAAVAKSKQRALCLDLAGELRLFSMNDGTAGPPVKPGSAPAVISESRGVPPAHRIVWNQSGTEIAAFSPDRSTSNSAQLHLWADDGTRSSSCGALPDQIAAICFDPADGQVAIATDSGRLWKWDGRSASSPAPFLDEHFDPAYWVKSQISFSPDGRYVATRSGIIDRQRNERLWQVAHLRQTELKSIFTWSPSSNVVAVIQNRPESTPVVSFHKPNGEAIGENDFASGPEQVDPVSVSHVETARWSPDGKWLAVPRSNPTHVEFFGVDSGMWRTIIAANNEAHYSNWDWTPDSRYLAGFAGGGNIVLISPADNSSVVRRFPLERYTTAMLALSPVGNRVALVHEQNTIRIHSVDVSEDFSVGSWNWQGRMFADGSCAAMGPSGRLLSHTGRGAENINCVVREYNGALTPYRYPDLLRRMQGPASQMAAMSVLSLGGLIHVNTGDSRTVHSPNSRGLDAVSAISGPVVADLTAVADVHAASVAPLKALPAGSTLDVTDNAWFTDDVLQILHENDGIFELKAAGTNLSARGDQTLGTLSELRVLELARTGIRDSTVQSLCKLKKLHSLDLSDTLISDRSLEYLRQMTQLRNLDISGCAFSADRVEEFIKERSGCLIDW